MRRAWKELNSTGGDTVGENLTRGASAMEKMIASDNAKSWR